MRSTLMDAKAYQFRQYRLLMILRERGKLPVSLVPRSKSRERPVRY
jgi:hypothetical protein